MGLNEKFDNKNDLNQSLRDNNIHDENDNGSRRSSSLSDISADQIFMPLSPTPESLKSFHDAVNNNNRKNLHSSSTNNNNIGGFINNINNNNKSKNVFFIPNSPRSINGNGGIPGGGGGGFGINNNFLHAGRFSDNGFKLNNNNNDTSRLTTPNSTKFKMPISTQQNNFKSLNAINDVQNDDFLTTYFDKNPLVDDYDLNLYIKQYPSYNAYHQPRYIDYDDEYLLLERIKQRIAKRDLALQQRRTPFLHENKELNVKIDITTDGAKVRELIRSRNGNNQTTTNNTTRTTNSRVFNLDYLNNSYNNLEDFNNVGNNHHVRKNSIATLPSIVDTSSEHNIHSNSNNISIGASHLLKSNRLKTDFIQSKNNEFNANYSSITPNHNLNTHSNSDENLRNNFFNNNNNNNNKIDPLKNPNIHEYLYSLSKKPVHEAGGYVDAFKVSQKRKSKVKPQYTIEDYRRFEPFGILKDPLDSLETDNDKSEKMKKRHEYANYVRNRNMHLYNDYNPKETPKVVNLNQRLAPIDHNKRMKTLPKSMPKLNHAHQKTIANSIHN